MNLMLRFAMIATLMLLATTGVARASDADMSVQIDWNPDQDVPENALWLAYLMSRAKYITDNKAAYEQKRGVVTPLFAEELAARTETVQVYLEHKEKDAQLKVAYFDDLARVAGQSFMYRRAAGAARGRHIASDESDLRSDPGSG